MCFNVDWKWRKAKLKQNLLSLRLHGIWLFIEMTLKNTGGVFEKGDVITCSIPLIEFQLHITAKCATRKHKPVFLCSWHPGVALCSYPSLSESTLHCRDGGETLHATLCHTSPLYEARVRYWFVPWGATAPQRPTRESRLGDKRT